MEKQNRSNKVGIGQSKKEYVKERNISIDNTNTMTKSRKSNKFTDEKVDIDNPVNIRHVVLSKSRLAGKYKVKNDTANPKQLGDKFINSAGESNKFVSAGKNLADTNEAARQHKFGYMPSSNKMSDKFATSQNMQDKSSDILKSKYISDSKSERFSFISEDNSKQSEMLKSQYKMDSKSEKFSDTNDVTIKKSDLLKAQYILNSKAQRFASHNQTSETPVVNQKYKLNESRYSNTLIISDSSISNMKKTAYMLDKNKKYSFKSSVDSNNFKINSQQIIKINRKIEFAYKNKYRNELNKTNKYYSDLKNDNLQKTDVSEVFQIAGDYANAAKSDTAEDTLKAFAFVPVKHLFKKAAKDTKLNTLPNAVGYVSAISNALNQGSDTGTAVNSAFTAVPKRFVLNKAYAFVNETYKSIKHKRSVERYVKQDSKLNKLAKRKDEYALKKSAEIYNKATSKKNAVNTVGNFIKEIAGSSIILMAGAGAGVISLLLVILFGTAAVALFPFVYITIDETDDDGKIIRTYQEEADVVDVIQHYIEIHQGVVNKTNDEIDKYFSDEHAAEVNAGLAYAIDPAKYSEYTVECLRFEEYSTHFETYGYWCDYNGNTYDTEPTLPGADYLTYVEEDDRPIYMGPRWHAETDGTRVPTDKFHYEMLAALDTFRIKNKVEAFLDDDTVKRFYNSLPFWEFSVEQEIETCEGCREKQVISHYYDEHGNLIEYTYSYEYCPGHLWDVLKLEFNFSMDEVIKMLEFDDDDKKTYKQVLKELKNY